MKEKSREKKQHKYNLFALSRYVSDQRKCNIDLLLLYFYQYDVLICKDKLEIRCFHKRNLTKLSLL